MPAQVSQILTERASDIAQSCSSVLRLLPWRPEARAFAQATMRRAATFTDPAGIINSALDALIRHGCELPALTALRRIAGAAYSNVNAAQWLKSTDVGSQR